MPVPQQELWQWHTRKGAFNRLSPPFEGAELESQFETMALNAQTILRVGIGPAKLRWVAQISAFEPPTLFQDTQLSGPFKKWVHSHRMEPLTASTSILEDSIEYELPVGPLGNALGGPSARKTIERMFAYRHELTRLDLLRHQAFADKPRLTVAVSGASGLIGSALCAFLTTGGHSVRRLVRGKKSPGSQDIAWNPAAGEVDLAALEGVDAVVHLAGESIADGPWTNKRKESILKSRVDGTRTLAEAFTKMQKPPAVFLSGSAIGFYGDRADEELTETSAPGAGFLADVCKQWESAAQPAKDKGIRVAHLRIGIVLSSAGGALKTLLLPFKLGAGGRVGSGQQWFSWVSLEDVLGAIYWALFQEQATGPLNLVSPNPVRQADFAKALGHVLSRPSFMPAPAFAMKAVMGEMADEMLLSGQKVLPEKLMKSGFAFQQASLEEALRFTLGYTL